VRTKYGVLLKIFITYFTILDNPSFVLLNVIFGPRSQFALNSFASGQHNSRGQPVCPIALLRVVKSALQLRVCSQERISVCLFTMYRINDHVSS